MMVTLLWSEIMDGYNTPDNGSDRSVKVGHEIRNTNRTQASERAEKYRVLSLVNMTFDLWPTFKVLRASDQTRLPCEFGANPFSRSRGISYTNTKVTDSAKNKI